MKKYIAIFAAALALASCKGDYLDTAPESDVATATIFTSTDNVNMAINGLSALMCKQYLHSQGYNGEGTIKLYFGEYPGNDLQKCRLTGWAPIMNMEYFQRQTSTYATYPWYYYYKIIGNANAVINNVDAATGTDADRKLYKAQALTYRAYCFTMLAQLYGWRWADSNNGASDGIVLRLDNSLGDYPISTLGETYDQIYKDLNDAITLYNEAGKTRGSDEFYKPNLNAAYAVYARAAITKQDWANAAKYAALARNGYPLMAVKDYTDGGFSKPNQEWIWGVYNAEDQTIYYYSMWSYMGSNASSSAGRTYPCAISKELYDQIPATDVRKAMFLEPTEKEIVNFQKVEAGNKVNGYAADGRCTKGDLLTKASAFYGTKIYGSTSYTYAYMQLKFQNVAQPGVGSFHLFRSAEMIYTEAEAEFKLGNESKAKALLEEAVKPYDNAYSCTKSGAELLNEIKLYRRFDLWGEGNNWFDYKRWGDPIVRHSWATGGSFATAFAKTIKPSFDNAWTWVIPYSETTYNGLVNPSVIKSEE